MKIGNMVSNVVAMAIGRGNHCEHPTSGFAGEDLDRARRNDRFSFGSVNLSRFILQIDLFGFPVTQTIDSATALFARMPASQLSRSQGPLGLSFQVGACTVYMNRGEIQRPLDPERGLRLDAGPQLSLAGPGGPRTFSKDPDGSYTVPGTMPFLTPGEYTIAGPGGAQPNAIGSFSVRVRMPENLSWQNQSLETVTRANGQIIRWSGGDPSGFVNIVGFSSVPGAGAGFVCTERTAAGEFNIPSHVLLTLPESEGFLLVGTTSTPSRFMAEGLDSGIATATIAAGKSITYR